MSPDLVPHNPVSLPDFATALEQGCRERRTGVFYLVTDRNHAATVSLEAGRIVGLRYRIVRHLAALDELLKARTVVYRFEPKPSLEAADLPALPPNEAIIERLRPTSADEPPIAASLPAAPASAEPRGSLPDGVKGALEAALVEQIGPVARIFTRQVFADTGDAAEASRRLAAHIPDAVRAERFKQAVQRLGVG